MSKETIPLSEPVKTSAANASKKASFTPEKSNPEASGETFWQGMGNALVDNRPSAVAQRKLATLMQFSTRMVAQQERQEQLFDPITQLKNVQGKNPEVIQFFPPAEPKRGENLDKWKSYLEELLKTFIDFNTDSNIDVFEITDLKQASVLFKTISTSIGRAKASIYAAKKDTKQESLALEVEGTLTKLYESIKIASEKVDEMSKPVLAPVTLDPLIMSWVTPIEGCLNLYKLPPDNIGAIIKCLNQFVIQKKMDEGFLKLFVLTLEEIYYVGINKMNALDYDNVCNHVLKFSIQTQRGEYSGLLAELQAANDVLKQGDFDPAIGIKFGTDLVRTKPFKNAPDSQDVDVLFTDNKGNIQYVEVKDSVATLETKMNIIIGKDDALDPEHKNDSRQLASLQSLCQDDAKKGIASKLTIKCISSFGWVRFILGRNCQKIIDSGATLDIAGVIFNPGKLRALREMITLEMAKSHTDKWQETYNDPTLPKVTKGGPAGNRHEFAWVYEEANPSPPHI